MNAHHPKRRGLLAGASLAALLPLSRAIAQPRWPSKPITYLVPYAPGGGTDTVARVLAPHMGESLGTSVVVVNKAGAGGNIGTAELARSLPDGHTIGGGSVASHAINGSLYPRLPYAMEQDFSPVTLAGTMPNLLIVHGDSPYRSVADLVRAGQAKGARLAYASAGNGTSQHLCMELFKLQSGIDAVHVAYKGAGPAVQAVMAGEAPFSFENLAVAAPQLASGRIRALAISSAQRLPDWPEVPTVAESGFPGFEVTSWQAVFAPAGVPAEVLARLNAAAVAALQRSDVKQRFATLGMQVAPSSPEELRRFQRAEIQKWARVIKDAGITLS